MFKKVSDQVIKSLGFISVSMVLFQIVYNLLTGGNSLSFIFFLCVSFQCINILWFRELESKTTILEDRIKELEGRGGEQ